MTYDAAGLAWTSCFARNRNIINTLGLVNPLGKGGKWRCTHAFHTCGRVWTCSLSRMARSDAETTDIRRHKWRSTAGPHAHVHETDHLPPVRPPDRPRAGGGQHLPRLR